MKAMAKHRARSIEFKRQIAEDFIAGETLHALALLYKNERRNFHSACSAARSF
jgi:hypothetical protein